MILDTTVTKEEVEKKIMARKLINQTPATEWKRLNELLGRRPSPGTPLYSPHELGYACPVCGASDEVNLEWSEFNGMIWCGKCKEDWPSCICKVYFEPKLSNRKLDKYQKARENKRVFIAIIDDIKNPKLPRQDIMPKTDKKRLGLEDFL